MSVMNIQSITQLNQMNSQPLKPRVSFGSNCCKALDQTPNEDCFEKTTTPDTIESLKSKLKESNEALKFACKLLVIGGMKPSAGDENK